MRWNQKTDPGTSYPTSQFTIVQVPCTMLFMIEILVLFPTLSILPPSSPLLPSSLPLLPFCHPSTSSSGSLSSSSHLSPHLLFSFISFPNSRYGSLREVPAYPNFIQERFERCLDLYLCPRQRKMRVHMLSLLCDTSSGFCLHSMLHSMQLTCISYCVFSSGSSGS